MVGIIKLIDKKAWNLTKRKKLRLCALYRTIRRSLIGKRSFLKKLRKDYKYKVDEIGLQGMYQLVQMYPPTDRYSH